MTREWSRAETADILSAVTGVKNIPDLISVLNKKIPIDDLHDKKDIKDYVCKNFPTEKLVQCIEKDALKEILTDYAQIYVNECNPRELYTDAGIIGIAIDIIKEMCIEDYKNKILSRVKDDLTSIHDSL